MGFTAFPSPDTAGSGLARRFGVGEVADFSGVPQAYQASDSFWMLSATWFARAVIPAAVRTLLGSNPAGEYIAMASATRHALATNARFLSASVPPATLPGLVAFQTRNPGLVLLVDVDGPRLVATGLSGMVALISDGTALWAFASGGPLNAATGVARSTDGKTWVPQAITGWPAAYTVRPQLYPFTARAGGLHTSSAQGFFNGDWTASNQSGFFWTGARYLAIVDDGTNFYACRSTNGLAWTDDSAQVLGVASVAAANAPVVFWRNGNTAFLKVGTVYRYTTDGGLNWSAVATAPTALVGGYLQRNAADPARLVASLDYTSLFVSTNSGQTWTSRFAAAGVTDMQGGVAYLGSNLLVLSFSTATLRRSGDDGATWSTVLLPPSVLGVPKRIVADAYRIYLFMDSGQVVTTTDGLTWIARAGTGRNFVASAAAAISSSVTLFVEEYVGGTGTGVFTLDGGITYTPAQMRPGANPGVSTAVGITVGGVSYFVGGSENVNADSRDFFIDVADLQAGGAMFRASTALIPAARTNLAAFVRVA